MAVFTYNYTEGKPEVRYEGCVIDTFERNGSYDSDWYAVCWNDEKQKIDHVLYDTTRCGGYGSAEIDASEDTLRKVYRFYRNQERNRFDAYSNKSQAQEVRKGDTVIVTRGRKTPKGTVGKVFWLGSRYNYYSHCNEDRVGIELEDGEKVFLPLDYVEVNEWETRLIRGRKRKQIIRNMTINSMPIQYRELFA